MKTEVIDHIEGMHPVEQAIRAWEAKAEAQGWDRPPVMASIVEGQMPTGWGLAVVVWPIDEWTDPRLTLRVLETSVINDPEMRAMCRADGESLTYRGIAFLYEAWSIKTHDRERAERVARERSMHQQPDRIECRSVLAVSMAPMPIMSLVRIRGGFPALDSAGLDGMFINILVSMHNALMSDAP